MGAVIPIETFRTTNSENPDELGTFSISVRVDRKTLRFEQADYESGRANAFEVPHDMVPDFLDGLGKAVVELQKQAELDSKRKEIPW